MKVTLKFTGEACESRHVFVFWFIFYGAPATSEYRSQELVVLHG
jgi:hypothetical protein